MHGRRSLSPLVALVLPVLLAAVGSAVHAQDAAGAPNPPPHRRSIGLVLSGGGARGGAHIGVLKALEELHVPVDYLAGTSIGAVIGGFYASGMTVPEMEKLVDSLEWDRAFLNVTPRQLKSYRRKRDDDLFLVDQKPGIDGGQFQLPVGLVQGQVIDTIISRETLRASEVEELRRPPRPVPRRGRRPRDGRRRGPRSGNLARSLRASMSIPAALTPIEIDGRLLVDGGMSMNLPVDVAHQMGADVIIAVDISSTLLTRDTLTLRARRNGAAHEPAHPRGPRRAARKLHGDDILMRPAFGADLSSINFARMREAIQAGYDAVMEHRAQFERARALEDRLRGIRRQHASDPRMRELPVDRLRTPRQQLGDRRQRRADAARATSTSASSSTSTRSSAR